MIRHHPPPTRGEPMKFMRRPDLDTQTRIEIVLQVWLHQGVYGKMTQIAAYYQISRTFLYQLFIMATLHLEILFSEEKLLFEKDQRHLEQLILLLRLEGKCSIQSISAILQELGYGPNSVGHLSTFLQHYGTEVASTLTMPSLKLVFYLSDEIFAIRSPILVTIDAQSTAILKIALAADRSEETWRAHFAELEDHQFVSLGLASDRGVGLVAGYQAALEKALWVCDYFHEFRDLFKILYQWERKAYAAIGQEEEAARKFQNAQSQANLKKRLEHYEQAHQVCEEAIHRYDQLALLLNLLRETLQFCDFGGSIRSKEQVRSELTLVLQWLAEIDHPALKEALTPIHKHLDDILVPFVQAESVYAQLQQQVPRQALDFLVLAWQHEHSFHQSRSKQKHYHHRESQEWLAFAQGLLGHEFDSLKALVFAQMDSLIRASSLVEMVNSLLRPYLNSCKGQITQEALNLIMFYHNHHRYKSGKRKGQAPLELLTGESLQAEWLDLLIQQVPASNGWETADSISSEGGKNIDGEELQEKTPYAEAA